MLSDVLHCGSLHGISLKTSIQYCKIQYYYYSTVQYLQHVTEKADHTLVQIVRDGEDSRFYLPEECSHVLIIKWQCAAQ